MLYIQFHEAQTKARRRPAKGAFAQDPQGHLACVEDSSGYSRDDYERISGAVGRDVFTGGRR
jgi:hypothetical protein